MRNEEAMKHQAIKEELAKINKFSPNAIPLYIIINSFNKDEAIEQPLTLCNKDSSVKDFLDKIHKKYPKYRNVYFFGRSKSKGEQIDRKSSLKTKRKRKSSSFLDEPERLIEIDESTLVKKMEDLHEKYKDSFGLLIIVVSEAPLLKTKKQSIFEPLLYILALLFAAAFMYVSFSQQSVAKNKSQLDYIV